MLVTLHVILWTLILMVLKEAQDIHMDVAEGYAWGQKFELGYGKHPPLSGWIAGLWFLLFPAADWSTYALAMATVGCGLVICWLIALRVVDRSRALFTVLTLALYPIFNFKGFKYNPDILQLVTLPLVVLAYLNAFEKRSWQSGIWLGIAGALALMTKYWTLTVIGAIGIAALLHPHRMKFFLSPAPWIALVAMIILMLPHVWWLREVDFAPLVYAGDVYALASRSETLNPIASYLAHTIALLALPIGLSALALIDPRNPVTSMREALTSAERGNRMNKAQALNIWVIQAAVALGPPLGAFAFVIYMKTDWGIPLFFLVPLVLVPFVNLKRLALFRLAAMWLVLTLLTLAAAPSIVVYEVRSQQSNSAVMGSRSVLADRLTNEWHSRFSTRWAVVAATTEIGQHMAFYSVDHPAPYTPGETWSSGLASLEEAKRKGFIGVCDPSDPRVPTCRSWMASNAATAERITITTHRSFSGIIGPTSIWEVYIVRPSSAADGPDRPASSKG
ncbi:glycosyltransferase family 39 protein [Bradyrhizobium sp. CCBAU 11386]|uniref:glycosyltransferase family 39 protein n=1 Tax=Bradyrhizobium sp. CCBAU 11386 TaxID=1630837 RepID=UPI002304CA91|nr:glycosyltransferase family 39 protein [Bradyrhizobium sp. CCBAU 11386]